MKRQTRTPLAAACGAVVVMALSGAALAADAPPAQQQTAAPAQQPAQQQQAAAPATTPPAQPTDWTDSIKQPVNWFKWGADLRIRQEYIYNPFFLTTDPPGHEWNTIRIRERAWASISPTDNFDVNIRLTDEMHYWFTPQSRPMNSEEGGSLRDASGRFDYSDVVFDNLNLKLKNLFETKSTLTIGRQDFLTAKGAPAFGDGWLILDGTPLDGSATVYFDAARFNIDLEKLKTNLDLVYIEQKGDPDAWLPPINSDSYPSNSEQDERGAVVYARNSSIDRTQVDAYFIYKHDHPHLANGDRGDIYTFGSRIAHDFNKNLRGTIEGAYQFGNRNNPAMFGAQDNDLSAWGMTSKLTYAFNDQWNNRLYAGMEMLSGDDADSSTNGQFDPLWARWPQWSELYIYSYATETRIAETTNLIHPSIGWIANPTKQIELSASYQPLWAFEDTRATQGKAGFSGGNFRGQLVTAILKYKFNQHFGAHLWTEYFFTGNFYDTAGSRETNNEAFLRWEVYFTF